MTQTSDSTDTLSAPVSTPTPLRPFHTFVSDPTILEALERLNIKDPTPVQAATVPLANEGIDLIVQAQTGSGKTLAFVLPLIARLAQHAQQEGADTESTFGIIVTPTRELAVQIVAATNSLAPTFRPPCLIGGVSINQQIRELEADRRVIVGTPGRILDHLQQRTIDLRKCEYFVLDEADEMLSIGFLEAVTEILKSLPRKRQGLFVSATISPRVEQLARTYLKDPERVIVDAPMEAHPSITHEYCQVAPELTAKLTALCDILETVNPKSAIIFCNTKSDTELVEKFLRRRAFDARCLNSDLNQKQREYVMEKIRAGELRYLVGTDIAARGIDIAQIELVVNYSLSDQAEVYMHRTGRTGRAGRSGKAISLIGPADFGAFTNLKRHTTVELTKRELPAESEVLEARVGHLLRILDEAQPVIHARDEELAKALLAKYGMENTSDEVTKVIGRLTRFSIDHFLNFEAKSLEEEMGARPGEPARPPQQQAPRQNDGNSRGRDSGSRDNGGRSQSRNSGRDSRGGGRSRTER